MLSRVWMQDLTLTPTPTLHESLHPQGILGFSSEYPLTWAWWNVSHQVPLFVDLYHHLSSTIAARRQICAGSELNRCHIWVLFFMGLSHPPCSRKKNIFTLDKPLLVSSNGSSSWVALFYKGRSKPMVKTWFGSEGGPGLCQNEAGIALVLSSENKLCFAVKPPLSFTVRGHGWLMPPINVSFCLFTGAKCTANAFWPREASALFGCACVK